MRSMFRGPRGEDVVHCDAAGSGFCCACYLGIMYFSMRAELRNAQGNKRTWALLCVSMGLCA